MFLLIRTQMNMLTSRKFCFLTACLTQLQTEAWCERDNGDLAKQTHEPIKQLINKSKKKGNEPMSNNEEHTFIT